MSEKRWTAPQLKAIEASGTDLLVSAAAGSGKTAVLTERLIRRLTDENLGLELSRVLIVTFTRAAAAELRERIGQVLNKAVKENPDRLDLVRKSLNISGAHIETIHSFCLSLIRSNFASLGIDPAVRVADESESLTTALYVMDKVIDSLYESAEKEEADSLTKSFIRLTDTFVTDRDDRLAEKLYGIYQKTESYKDRINIIKRSAEELTSGAKRDFFETCWGKIIRYGLRDELSFYKTIYDDAIDYFSSTPELEKKYLPAFGSDHSFICNMLTALEQGYTETRSSAESFSRVSIGRTRIADDESSLFYKKIRKSFDEFYKSLLKKLALTHDQISDSMLRAADLCNSLYNVLDSFEKQYSVEKKRRGIIDYSDIEHLTLKLLTNDDGSLSDAARQISEEFDEIYIDEYQDISPVQDAIFTAIGRNNRFMVGDIKQSIYSFRGAEPDIFASYRERFPKLDSTEEDAGANRPGNTVYLSHNFRCDKSIIDFTNDIFSALMRRDCGSSLDYSEDDRLVFAKLCEDGQAPVPVRVTLISPSEDIDDKKAIPPIDAEAEYVAAESARLIASGRYRPGDIRILLRSGADNTERFAKAFAAHRIPFERRGIVGFFERPHVLSVLSLLRCIDNPTRDIPLVAVLSGPLFRFTANELTAIKHDIPLDNMRADKPSENSDSSPTQKVSFLDALKSYCNKYSYKKGTDFLCILKDLRKHAAVMPVDKLIWKLYDETAVMFCGDHGDRFSSSERRADLLRLYDYARSFESGAFRGLSSFVRSIDELLSRNPHFNFKEESVESTDAVSVMTIHGSKGLEFPVCFICGAAKGINKKDSTELILLDRTLGVCPKLRHGAFTRINTPMRSAAAKLAIEKSIDEELRILYVAMTRAREILYITAASEKPDSILRDAEICSKYPSRFTMVKSASYMKWILSALAIKDKSLIPSICETLSDTAIAIGNCAIAEIRRYKTENGKAVFSDTVSTSEENPKKHKQTNISPQNGTKIQSSELGMLLSSRLSEKYSGDYGARLPAKLSVSDLHPGILDEDPPLSPDKAKLYSTGEPFPIPTVLRESDPVDPDSDSYDTVCAERYGACSNVKPPQGLRLPRFLEGEKEHLNGTDRGTATHVFMQFCDWENVCSRGVRAEIERMTQKNFMTEEMSKLVYIPMLERFFKSELFAELRAAKRTWRELRFNVLLPASRFTDDTERAAMLREEKLLVQGIIDCLYITEDGKFQLLDYKTDRLPHNRAKAEAILRERYSDQLLSYREAASIITGMPVERCIIYALGPGIEIEI